MMFASFEKAYQIRARRDILPQSKELLFNKYLKS